MFLIPILVAIASAGVIGANFGWWWAIPAFVVAGVVTFITLFALDPKK